MDNLTDEMQEKMAQLDEAFEHWESQIELECQKAVFRGDQDAMEVLLRVLKKNQMAIADIIRSLEKHFDKNTSSSEILDDVRLTPSPPELPLWLQVQANQPMLSSRMAASLPGMNMQHGPVPGYVSSVPSTIASVFPGSVPVRNLPPSSMVPAWLQKNLGILSEPRVPSSFYQFGLETVETQSPRSSDTTPPNSLADSSSSSTLQPRKIFVVNLDRKSTSQSIAQYFKKYGTVVDVKIFRFPSGESRGLGSVEFTDERSARKSIEIGKHFIDNRETEAKPFHSTEKVGPRMGRRFQIFLGGVPSFLSNEEVKMEIRKVVKIRDIKVNSERGYAYLDLEDEDDVRRLINKGYIKIGEKMVECKENIHNRA